MIRKVVIVVLTLGAIATAVLWAITISNHYVWWNNRSDTTSVILEGYVLNGAMVASFRTRRVKYVGMMPPQQRIEVAGFHYVFGPNYLSIPSGRLSGIWRVDSITIPLWFPYVVLIAYPTLAIIRRRLRRWRRRKRGECVHCGYNLTGNVTGVCSECGSVFDSARRF